MSALTEDKILEIVTSIFDIKKEQIIKSENNEFFLKYEDQDIKFQ